MAASEKCAYPGCCRRHEWIVAVAVCWRVPCVGAMVAVGAGRFVTTVGGVKSVVVDFVGQVQYSRFFDWCFFFSFRRIVDSNTGLEAHGP